MRMRAGPTIYEINTATWLQRLGRRFGRRLGLGDVPGPEWDALAALPIDAVWLMGVWERSPTGRAVAMAMPQLQAGYRAALPDLREDDVLGSPYCVRDYVVDERFGGPAGLAVAREQLRQRGVALILDYVPNHIAADHPWVTERRDCLLAGSEEDLALHPEAFMRVAGGVYAKGRDPYFEPWQDVLQLNAFSPELRRAAAETMATIGDQCDGVRSDMAMLMTNEVFARTWGERAGPAPDGEYWPALIEGSKQAHPDFLFMAEVYWDMEWTLQQQGFDLCYDKRLYDRLVHDSPESVRGHLRADPAYQGHLIRFIENHDEPRAAVTFGSARERAAAVVMSTLQGARLYHHGQLEGARTHVPIQLGREPDEPPDPDLREFYGRLLRAVAEAPVSSGDWRLCDCASWSDDSYLQLVAWCWRGSQARRLVVVNLAPARAEGRVRLAWADVAGRTWRVADRLSQERFTRSGDELARDGLRVALDSWESRFLVLESSLDTSIGETL
jgi:Alpha amylase, catalytic domain